MDWSDGHIDGTYPLGCYRRALRALPDDIRLYSSATDDITRALARQVRAATRSVAGGIVATRSASPSTAARAGNSGFGAIEPSLVLGGSIVILVAALAGGAFVARRKLSAHRTR